MRPFDFVSALTRHCLLGFAGFCFLTWLSGLFCLTLPCFSGILMPGKRCSRFASCLGAWRMPFDAARRAQQQQLKYTARSTAHYEAPPDFRADAHRRLRRITWPSISCIASVWEPASKIYFLCLVEHINGIDEVELCWRFAVFFGASGEGLFPKTPVKGFPKELLLNSNFHFV